MNATVIRLSCVLGSEYNQYDSGGEEDVKYRIGKAMYKPAANLKGLTNTERFYSLCSSYVILKDAFDHSSLDSNYSVEIAYYYLMVCTNVAEVMEPGQCEDIYMRGMAAYYQFELRGKRYPDNLTYIKYRDEAECAREHLNEIYR